MNPDIIVIGCGNAALCAALAAREGGASVLIATFALTLLRDLTTGIVAGCVLAAVFAALNRGVQEEGD